MHVQMMIQLPNYWNSHEYSFQRIYDLISRSIGIHRARDAPRLVLVALQKNWVYDYDYEL